MGKLNDFQQKIRSVAREITDIAISKVPCIQLYGFDNLQNKAIQEMHKRLLKFAKVLNHETHTKVRKQIQKMGDNERKVVQHYIRVLSTKDLMQKQKIYDSLDKNTSIPNNIKEAIFLYDNNLMEVGILIDLHFLGELEPQYEDMHYWVIRGTAPRRVKMEDNLKAKQAMDTYSKNRLLFMHNHPSTGTFSGEDLKMFWSNQSVFILTAVGNDGCIYLLEKGKDFDPEKLSREYYSLASKYKVKRNNATLAVKDILNNAQKYGMEYKKGRKKA